MNVMKTNTKKLHHSYLENCIRINNYEADTIQKTLTIAGHKTCSICKRIFIGRGHNPQPVANLKVSNRCCRVCNDTVVIPRRYREINMEIN